MTISEKLELLNYCILIFNAKKLRNSSTYGKFGGVNE